MNSSTPDSYTNSTTPSIELTVCLEMCVFTFNFLFGLLTHSYVIWLIVTGTGIASEFFILNLSTSEEEMNSTTTGASTNTATPSTSPWDGAQNPLFIINVLFGLPTHSYVIWIIVTRTGSGVASEFFNLSNSFCEIGICVDFLIFMLASYISSLFPLAMFLQGFTITGRPLFQCLICVERYLAVVHPVTFLKYKPLRYRVICCTVVLIITLGSCLICLIIFIFSTITMQAWFFSMQFLLCLPIQLFCLVAVLRALKQSGPGERTRERDELKTRAFYLILITTVTMAITYVPTTISGFFTIVTQQFNLIAWIPSMTCYVLAGFVQPVLNLHRAGKLSFLCTQ
ncbi:G-protein coupled receptor 4-like [Cyprinus carpio]|uniref:G-protein coupled receptor 4-like n=1 Tax=Cyprinus carpio TaxID=7962 RepID=A0A9Q9VLS0_CYPCA|nr:G-protein coupled receptor 4-like [Cyprinus carpio]